MKAIVFALISISFAACTSGEHGPQERENRGNLPLAPPAPGLGIQLRMTRTIAPGVESYGCKLFQLPDDGLFVHEETVQFGSGGHHVLLHKTPYEAIPEMDELGNALDATDVHDCSEGVTARWKVDSVIGGSEIFGGLGMLRGLPDGVAVHLPGKTVLVMSVHYLNASPSPVDVDARMNLSTLPEKDVITQAGLLYLDNHLLHVPAMGTSTARMRCPVPSDVSIVNLQSHMHSRGLRFTASVLDAMDGAPKTIYETTHWLEPPIETFTPFLTLSQGQTIELRCDYASTEARSIVYGLQSMDEMCQLIGPYFPRDERLENCANAKGEPAVSWVGQGSADGATTRKCLECAPSFGGAEYVACLMDSCSSIAAQTSAVARCQRARGLGGCRDEMEVLGEAGCF